MKAAHKVSQNNLTQHYQTPNGTLVKGSSANDYLKKFKNMIEVVEHCGGSICNDPTLNDLVLKDMGLTVSTVNNQEKDLAQATATECYRFNWIMTSELWFPGDEVTNDVACGSHLT